MQDAERRDFTINSMFYNIAERTVEDFTQRVREPKALSLHSEALAD